MIGRWPCIVVAMLFLLAVVTSASAAGAWVMWMHGTGTLGDEWALASAYENKAQCDFGVTSGLLQLSNQLRKNPDFRNFSSYGSPGNFVLTFDLVVGGKSEVLFICLPDTVDPRGLKGK